MTIQRKPMRIRTWNPTFKPIEETPILSVVIGLSELPWHSY